MMLNALKSISPKSRMTCRLSSKSIKELVSCEAGNFAMITGIAAPVLIMGTLYGTDAYYRTSKTEKFNEYVEKVCYRALKLRRTQVMENADRASTAETIFNGAFPAEYKNLKTTFDVKMTEVTATASAEFDPLLNLIGSGPVSIQYTINCDGIPPYPHDGEILHQNVKPEGFENWSSYCYWSSYAKYIGYYGWDGIHTFTRAKRLILGEERNINGPRQVKADGSWAETYAENQWWGRGPNGNRSGCWKPTEEKHVLPAYSTPTIDSEFAFEMDYSSNTELYKNLELHPGHYKVGFWYYPKASSKWNPDEKLQRLTNLVGVYIQGTENVSHVKVTLNCIAGPNSWGWRYFHLDFIVATYGIYTLRMAGEGISDGIGGLINSVQVIYHDDLNTTKTYYDSFDYPEFNLESTAAKNRPSNCTDWVINTWR